MADFDGDGLVGVGGGELHVRRVVHEEGAEEVRRPDASTSPIRPLARVTMGKRSSCSTRARADAHDGIESSLAANCPSQIVQEPLAVRVCLKSAAI